MANCFPFVCLPEASFILFLLPVHITNNNSSHGDDEDEDEDEGGGEEPELELELELEQDGRLHSTG